MNINTYSYVLVVAALGMGIVFVFLWILSVLMSLIKRLFGDRPNPPEKSQPLAEQDEAGPPLADRGNNWMIAAVVAYLEAEHLDQASDPGPWVSGRSHHDNPWVTAIGRKS